MNFKKAVAWMIDNPFEVMIGPDYIRYRWTDRTLQYFDNSSNNWNVAGFNFTFKEVEGPWRKEVFHQDDSIEVIRYCLSHIEQMWAAKIIGILLRCDFRDSKNTAEEFLKELEGDN